jgi:hypothetical protein
MAVFLQENGHRVATGKLAWIAISANDSGFGKNKVARTA